jgi:predicted porin
MKRKALALAVGALFAAPAAHAQLTMGNDQIGTFQIYGKFYPQVATFKGTDATQPGETMSTLVAAPAAAVPDHGNRLSVDSQNSYLGFRGERNIMAGWKAMIQLEQSVDLEFDAAGGTFSNRNTFAGLGHKTFGTVKLGNMDTIYKEYGDTMSMFGISSGNFVSASNVLSHIGTGSSNTARFHERRPHSIQYQTGEFGGFQGGIQYAPDELKGDPGRTINAYTLSYGVKWDSERFYVSLHQERHNDLFGGSNNVAAAVANSTAVTGATRSKDTGTRLSGEFRFLGTQRIVADVAWLQYKESGQVGAGRFAEYKKPNWAIGWDGGFGAWRIATQLVVAGEGKCSLSGGTSCSTTGLGAALWTIGTRYRFDRQTFIYAIAGFVSMDTSALHDNWANGTPSRGSDTMQTALGISYTF